MTWFRWFQFWSAHNVTDVILLKCKCWNVNFTNYNIPDIIYLNLVFQETFLQVNCTERTKLLIYYDNLNEYILWFSPHPKVTLSIRSSLPFLKINCSKITKLLSYCDNHVFPLTHVLLYCTVQSSNMIALPTEQLSMSKNETAVDHDRLATNPMTEKTENTLREDF